MDPIVTAGLISAGGNLAGGLLGSDATRSANAANVRFQREFAQNGLTWKVEDAKRAGIHPLAALGASTASFSPSVVADTSMGDALKDMGQDISRAVSQTKTDAEKAIIKAQVESWDADVAGKKLDNQIKQKQLDQLNMKTPSFPGSDYLLPGQASSGLVTGKPMERTRSRSTSPHSEGGPIADVGWAEIDPGVFVAIPSKDIKERIEDNIFHEGTHFMRNFFKEPPKDWLSPGQEWRYSWSRGGYVKSRKTEKPIYRGRPSYMNK